MQLQNLMRIVNERRSIIMLAFFTTVVTTLVASLMWPAKYESMATIMLDYDSSNPMNMNMSMVPPQALTSVEYINTQIEIIKSRRIAEGVVDILGLDKVPDIIESYNRAKQVNPLFFWRTPLQMNIKRWLADGILSRSVKAEPARDSRFLYIKFYSSDPKFAAAAANAFAKAYNDYNLELKVSPFKEAGKWFSEKLKDVKGQSDKASEQLREYQQKKGIKIGRASCRERVYRLV
jgi:polysaccharide biosynthesis transport protein